MKDFEWKCVKASHLILKAKVTTLLPLGLVTLLYSVVAVLLPLGINHLPNTGAGLSSACHAGSVPSEILAAAPLSHHSSATLGILHVTRWGRPTCCPTQRSGYGPRQVLGASLRSGQCGLAEATL